MSEEWGEWVEHDGRGCPVPRGTYVQVLLLSSPAGATITRAGPALTEGDGSGKSWDWSNFPVFKKVLRYRIRKPKALEQLRKIARDVETPLVNTPKEPVRA